MASPRGQVASGGVSSSGSGATLSPGEDEGAKTAWPGSVVPSFTAHGSLYWFLSVSLFLWPRRRLLGHRRNVQPWGWAVKGEPRGWGASRSLCWLQPGRHALQGRLVSWEWRSPGSRRGTAWGGLSWGTGSPWRSRETVQREGASPRGVKAKGAVCLGRGPLSSVLRHLLGCELDSSPGMKRLPGQRWQTPGPPGLPWPLPDIAHLSLLSSADLRGSPSPARGRPASHRGGHPTCVP